MGQDATATLSEIEAARQRLERDVDVLEERVGRRLREQAIATGRAAAVVGVGVVVVGGGARRRLRRRAERRRARMQAEALADVLEARHGDRRDGDGRTPTPGEFGSSLALLAAIVALVATIVQVVGRTSRRR